jgi:hypothetical protein
MLGFTDFCRSAWIAQQILAIHSAASAEMKHIHIILLVSTLVFPVAQADIGLVPPEPVMALVKEKENISSEVIRATRDFRERLLADPYRPAYHFSFPEDQGVPGDPNGAFYKDGIYHLMYLYKKVGVGFAWGHVSSSDLLHWRFHADALVPGDSDEGIFSGGAFVDDDGTSVLSYWMLWGAKGIGYRGVEKITVQPRYQITRMGHH